MVPLLTIWRSDDCFCKHDIAFSMFPRWPKTSTCQCRLLRQAKRTHWEYIFSSKKGTIFYTLHKGGFKEAISFIDHPQSPFLVLHHVVCNPIISEELDGKLDCLGVG